MDKEQDQGPDGVTVEEMDEALQSPPENPEAEQEAQNESPEELGRLLEDARARADEHWDLVIRTKAEILFFMCFILFIHRLTQTVPRSPASLSHRHTSSLTGGERRPDYRIPHPSDYRRSFLSAWSAYV